MYLEIDVLGVGLNFCKSSLSAAYGHGFSGLSM